MDFGHSPILLEIVHLKEHQESVLTTIENYFEEHDLNYAAYPIVILTTLERYHSKFYLTQDRKKIPQFFKQKLKQLTLKENQKLNFVELKQTHLHNLILSEYSKIINEYSKNHKEIHYLNRENEFYKVLLERIDS